MFDFKKITDLQCFLAFNLAGYFLDINYDVILF